jgi:hypothetical protein
MDWTQEITFLTPVLIAGIGFGVAQLKSYQASAAAQKHQALNYLAGLGVRIGGDAMALLRSTPNLTPAGALSWAVNEFQATAPDAISSLGADATSAGVENLVRRGILSSAQGGPLDDAATAVIKALAPSAATAKVSPNQLAAVSAAVASAAPITIEAVRAMIQAALAAPATPTDPTATPPSPPPVAAPAPAQT